MHHAGCSRNDCLFASIALEISCGRLVRLFGSRWFWKCGPSQVLVCKNVDLFSPGWVAPTCHGHASVRVVRCEGGGMCSCVTIPRMWMARPSQTRSGHWGVAVRQCTEVTKEGCTAPGWLTEQGKALALGSGRFSCQNPDVVQRRCEPPLDHLAKTFALYYRKTAPPELTSVFSELRLL